MVIWTDAVLTDRGLSLYDSRSILVADDDHSGPQGAFGDPIKAEIVYEAPFTGSYFVHVYVTVDVPGGSYIINAEILE